jgi:hypothetical protein
MRKKLENNLLTLLTDLPPQMGTTGDCVGTLSSHDVHTSVVRATRKGREGENERVRERKKYN